MFNGEVNLRGLLGEDALRVQVAARFARGHLARDEAGRHARSGRCELPREVQARELGAHLGFPKRGLAQRVGQAVGVPLVARVLLLEFAVGEASGVDDVGTQVASEVRFEARQDFFEVAVALVALFLQAGGKGDEEEEVFAALGRDAVVGA